VKVVAGRKKHFMLHMWEMGVDTKNGGPYLCIILSELGDYM
jgi:hypothetical protein